jgi:hypothetical protein
MRFIVSLKCFPCSLTAAADLLADISSSSAKSGGGCKCAPGKCQCLDCKSCVKKPVTIARI